MNTGYYSHVLFHMTAVHVKMGEQPWRGIMRFLHIVTLVFIALAMVACERELPARPEASASRGSDDGGIILYEASKHQKGVAPRHAPANARKAIKKEKTQEMDGTVGTVKIGKPGSSPAKKVTVTPPRKQCAEKKVKITAQTSAQKPPVKSSTVKADEPKAPAQKSSAK